MKPFILFSIIPLLFFTTSCGNQSPKPNKSLQYLRGYIVDDARLNNNDSLMYWIADGFLDKVANAKPAMPLKTITIGTIELVSLNNMDTILVSILGDNKTFVHSTGGYYEASDSLLVVKRVIRKQEDLDAITIPCPEYNFDSLAKYNFPDGFTSSSSNRPSFALHCSCWKVWGVPYYRPV